MDYGTGTKYLVSYNILVFKHAKLFAGKLFFFIAQFANETNKSDIAYFGDVYIQCCQQQIFQTNKMHMALKGSYLISNIPKRITSFMGILAILNPLTMQCYTFVSCWSRLIYTKLS